MADVITQFKLETTQYDSKLRDAAKGLKNVVDVAKNAGNSFTGFSQKAVEAARALGNTASGATNTKDKVKDLVGSFNDAAKAYNKLTEEQQKSDFGRELSQSLTVLQGRIREAKQELYGLGDAVEKAGKGGGLFGGAKNMMGAIGISPTMLTGIGAATAAFGALKGAIEGNISTAFNFERSMSQLSSLTGKTGKDLETLKEYAIELGSTTTLTASQVADAFRLIGSQQPQLLESSEALKAVTKNAITLSEAAGIDLSTAAQTLSTSINQFGGDSTRATEFINILAAASQKGAGDIGWLGDAITKSGTTAKAVGTDYNELVANLEMLAKAGYDASTAGTALRSIIMSLEKQSNDNFKPSIVGLTQAFKNLQDAQLTLTDYQNTAGKMFAAQAKALAENADEAFRLKDAITGTNIAEEQAATNTANLDGSLKSLSSAWEGLNLHINSSNGFLKEAVDWLKQVVTWADQAFTAAGRAQKKLAEMQGGGNGQPTKVDRQISALGGSNFKPQAFNAQMGRYNQDIKVAEYFLNKFNENHSSVNTVLMEASKRFGQKLNSISDLEAVRDAMVRMRDEYQSRAKTLMQSVTSSVTGTTGINEKPGINIEVDADTDGATKSIKELQAEVKKLTKLRDEAANAGDTKLRDQYNAQIKQTRQQIKVMQGTNTTSHTAATKADKEAEQTARMLAELRKQEAKATKEIAEARAREHRTETTGLSGFNEQTISAWTAMMKDQLSKADFGSVVYNNIEENMRDMTTITDLTKEALKRGLNPESLGLTEMFETAFDNIDVPDNTLQAIVEKINAAIKDGVKLEINAESGKVTGKKQERKNDTLGDTKKVISGLSQVAGGLQQMGVELPEGVQKVMGVIQGVMTAIEGINTIISLTQTPAIVANTVAMDALATALWTTGFFGFSQGGVVHAANGFSGVVPGNHFSGDNVPAMLNSGETVLNVGQSQNVASALIHAMQLADSVREMPAALDRAQQVGPASQIYEREGGGGLRIVGMLKGEDVVLMADRWGMRTGRGELLFGRNL